MAKAQIQSGKLLNVGISRAELKQSVGYMRPRLSADAVLGGIYQEKIIAIRSLTK